MGVDRSIELKIATDINYFSEIVQILYKEGYTFNADGTLMSLAENDIDDYDYIQYESFEAVRKVLDKRQDKGLSNYIDMWDKNIDDRLLITCRKTKNHYFRNYRNCFEIEFSIGYGVRINGADRYTDFGVYLNKLLPILIKNSIYVSQVNCSDLNC